MKEESKVPNCDWDDHQAGSLLQYINGLANPCIMENILMNCAKNE